MPLPPPADRVEQPPPPTVDKGYSSLLEQPLACVGGELLQLLPINRLTIHVSSQAKEIE